MFFVCSDILAIVRFATLLAAGLLWSVGIAGGVDREALASADQVAPEGRTLRLRSLGDRTPRPAEKELAVALTISGTYRTVGSFSFSLGVEGRWSTLTGASKRLLALLGGLDDPDLQKRANRSARRVASQFVAATIFPLLAAGLLWSVGIAGGVDREALASADQVAPEGRTLRLRSLGDRG